MAGKTLVQPTIQGFRRRNVAAAAKKSILPGMITPRINDFARAGKKFLYEVLDLYWELLKIMVPVMVLVKLALEFGLVEMISLAIAPLMHLVDLPGSMGIAWVTAMVVNIYGGAAVWLTLLPEHPLTIAQATVLGSMILIAHSLPVEQRVAQRAGAGFLITTILRLAAAFGYGLLLTWFYHNFEGFQQPATVIFVPAGGPASDWLGWTLSSVKTLLSIFWIILALLLTLRLLDLLRITPLLTRLVAPFLRLMGIGPEATSMAMTGTLLGLSYGGVLIIKEAQSGTLPDKDIFLALAFMCLCHGLIEDTLFVMTLGGHYSGLLIGRFLFTLALMIGLAKIIHALPEVHFRRYLFRAGNRQAAP